MKRSCPLCEKEVPIVRREDLRLSSAEVTAIYPPLPRFTGTEAGEFYTAVHPQHPFEILQLKGDSGCFMAIEEARSLEISRDEITYTERVESGIDLTRKNIEDLVKQAQDRFGIQTLFRPQVELRALWGVPDEAQPIGAKLMETALSVTPDHLAMLGEDVRGASITLTGLHAEAPHWQWDVEIAPYLLDETQLWVKIEGEFFHPVDSAQVLGELVQTTYDFLWENVTHFVRSVLP